MKWVKPNKSRQRIVISVNDTALVWLVIRFDIDKEQIVADKLSIELWKTEFKNI